MPPSPRRQVHQRHASSLTLDQRRWLDFRSGMSEAELAARENVKLETIQASIQRMRARQQSLSLESTNEAVREHIIESLPIAFAALEAALAADVYQPPPEQLAVATINTDDEGNIESVSASAPAIPPPPRPDHMLRLRAFKELKEMITSIQPKTPMVAVDARTQVNNNAPAMLANGQPLSAESIIRQIRSERGLSLTDGSAAAAPPLSVISAAIVADETTEVDYELQEELAEGETDVEDESSTDSKDVVE